jgi:hypothetical protein
MKIKVKIKIKIYYGIIIFDKMKIRIIKIIKIIIKMKF